MEKRVKTRTEELGEEMAARKKVLRESDSRESEHFIELRRQAEERMKVNDAVSSQSAIRVDPQKLLHNLQVYQMELEILNEELRRSKNENDALLAKYVDIYDFAPIGYFTLGVDATILQVNLTGASLLGVERSRLKGQQFRCHFSEELYPSFNAFFKKTFEGETIESYELMLPRKDSTPSRFVLLSHPVGGSFVGMKKIKDSTPSRFVLLRARLSEDKRECNLVMIDITERKLCKGESAEYTC
jgi:PAS domain-containing protein